MNSRLFPSAQLKRKEGERKRERKRERERGERERERGERRREREERERERDRGERERGERERESVRFALVFAVLSIFVGSRPRGLVCARRFVEGSWEKRMRS